MVWDTDRKARLPKDWPRRRLRILRRDRYQCQMPVYEGGPPCLAPANQVDHKLRGDDHSDENLWSLCRPHHARKSSQEGNAARLPNKRTPGKHPGLK